MYVVTRMFVCTFLEKFTYFTKAILDRILTTTNFAFPLETMLTCHMSC